MLWSDVDVLAKDTEAQVDFRLVSVWVEFVVSFISQVVKLKSLSLPLAIIFSLRMLTENAQKLKSLQALRRSSSIADV
jgi:hypothetical protein